MYATRTSTSLPVKETESRNTGTVIPDLRWKLRLALVGGCLQGGGLRGSLGREGRGGEDGAAREAASSGTMEAPGARRAQEDVSSRL